MRCCGLRGHNRGPATWWRQPSGSRCGTRPLTWPAFTTWLKETYLPRYPTPPRHAHFDPATALAAGFGEVSYAEDDIHVPLTRTQLADYLLSQSNAATAIESGAISADALRNQILGETAVFFPRQGHANAVFGIRVWTTVRRDQHPEGPQ